MKPVYARRATLPELRRSRPKSRVLCPEPTAFEHLRAKARPDTIVPATETAPGPLRAPGSKLAPFSSACPCTPGWRRSTRSCPGTGLAAHTNPAPYRTCASEVYRIERGTSPGRGKRSKNRIGQSAPQTRLNLPCPPHKFDSSAFCKPEIARFARILGLPSSAGTLGEISTAKFPRSKNGAAVRMLMPSLAFTSRPRHSAASSFNLKRQLSAIPSTRTAPEANMSGTSSGPRIKAGTRLIPGVARTRPIYRCRCCKPDRKLAGVPPLGTITFSRSPR